MTDDLLTHTLMTLLQDLVTVAFNNGFVHISKKCAAALVSVCHFQKPKIKCAVSFR
jgi:hypothetical protein